MSTTTNAKTAPNSRTGPTQTSALARSSQLLRGVGPQNISLLIALALLIIIFGVSAPETFFRPVNLISIASAVALLTVVALGETLVILSGGLDISVNSMVGLASVTSAWTLLHLGNNLILGLLTAVVVGTLAGLINGLIITVGRVNPVIATLGTLSAFQGIAYLISAGQTIPILNPSYALIGTARVAQIPVTVIIAVVAAVLFFFVLRATDIGRNVYVLGGNPVAARLAGIRTQGYKMGIYAVCGFAAGIGGIILSSRTQNGLALGSSGLELQAITAVVLGGAALTGGKGSIVGTIYGVLLIGILNNGLTVLNVQTFYQQVATGLLLIIAVMIQQFRADKPWTLRLRARRTQAGK